MQHWWTDDQMIPGIKFLHLLFKETCTRTWKSIFFARKMELLDWGLGAHDHFLLVWTGTKLNWGRGILSVLSAGGHSSSETRSSLLTQWWLFQNNKMQASELRTTRGGSRILVRGVQRSFDPRGSPEPKICSKLPENCMILNKSWGQGGPGPPRPGSASDNCAP